MGNDETDSAGLSRVFGRETETGKISDVFIIQGGFAPLVAANTKFCCGPSYRFFLSAATAAESVFKNLPPAYNYRRAMQQPSIPQLTTAMPSQPLPQSGPFVGGPSSGRGFIGRLAAACSAHAYLTLGVIVVLVVIVIGLLVYYRGLLWFGPYATGAPAAAKAARKASARGDDEADRLIDSINKGGRP